MWGKRDSRRDTTFKVATVDRKEGWKISRSLELYWQDLSYSCSAHVLEIMTPKHGAKTGTNAREASLSPPPLKKRKVESTTSRWVHSIPSEPTD